MIIQNQLYEEIDPSLRDFEVTLKNLWQRNPEQNLEFPHNLDEIRGILNQAAALYPNAFTRLLPKQMLEENSFFDPDSDVEIYQHLRYLPAYWHSHGFIEVACVLQGKCLNYVKNQKIEMESGDICIIAPGTRHAVSAFSDDCILFNFLIRISTFETAFFGVLSQNDILSDFFMQALYHSNQHPYLLFRTGEDQELLNYIGAARREFTRNRQYKSRMMDSILGAFFITLLRNHGASVILPESRSGVQNENVIYILKYMQANYATITLAELSASFNYSERQIQRIIKDNTGMSFSENIQKLKLKQAARLMQNPDISIAAVAEQVGYSDVGNFRHMFKKYYGMTPAEYRSS